MRAPDAEPGSAAAGIFAAFWRRLLRAWFPAAPFSVSATAKSNYAHLYWDSFGFGVLSGSTISFVAIYAVRVGASAMQVSLLSSGPAVVNLMFSLPAGRWLGRQQLGPATFRAGTLARIGYLLLSALPWLVPAGFMPLTLLALLLFVAVPNTFWAVGFNALFADTVAPEHRGFVVGRRSVVLGIRQVLASLLAGGVLSQLAFPIGYQIVFALGALGGGLSIYHLGRVQALDAPPVRVGSPQQLTIGSEVRSGDAFGVGMALRFLTRARQAPLLKLALLQGSFGSFIGAYFLFYTIQFITVPLIPVYAVQTLRLPDSVVSIGSALFFVGMGLSATLLFRLSVRWGHRLVLVGSGFLYLCYPLMNALARGSLVFYAAHLVGGGVWGILNAALLNRLMERVPEDDRPAHMALHNIALHLGILCGSSLAPLLAGTLGVREALFAGAGLRVVAGIVFWFFG